MSSNALSSNLAGECTSHSRWIINHCFKSLSNMGCMIAKMKLPYDIYYAYSMSFYLHPCDLPWTFNRVKMSPPNVTGHHTELSGVFHVQPGKKNILYCLCFTWLPLRYWYFRMDSNDHLGLPLVKPPFLYTIIFTRSDIFANPQIGIFLCSLVMYANCLCWNLTYQIGWLIYWRLWHQQGGEPKGMFLNVGRALY